MFATPENICLWCDMVHVLCFYSYCLWSRRGPDMSGGCKAVSYQCKVFGLWPGLLLPVSTPFLRKWQKLFRTRWCFLLLTVMRVCVCGGGGGGGVRQICPPTQKKVYWGKFVGPVMSAVFMHLIKASYAQQKSPLNSCGKAQLPKDIDIVK